MLCVPFGRSGTGLAFSLMIIDYSKEGEKAIGGKINVPSRLYFNENHEMVRRAIRDFVIKEVNPRLDEWEEDGIAPLHEIFGKMGDLGFLGIRYDTEVGGQGLDLWADLVFLEEIAHIKAMSLPMAVYVQTHCATPAMDEFGSQYLKRTYLTPAIEGKMVASIAITEPDAGSDVAALRTFAVRDGDTYVINGSKIYITNGCQADFVVLLARTSENPGYHSFSLMVVPTDTPGFTVGRKLDKIGMRSSDTAELFFDNVRVPAENLIGEEGEGFIYQMRQFQHERFTALPLGYVAGKDMINLTLEHIKKRIVFGEPLVKKQVLRHRIANWLTEIECLKDLTYHIVRMKEAGLDVTREVSMGKLKAGQLLRQVSDGCVQMFGGIGYMTEMLIARYFRDSRIIAIGGGADEVMCEVIARMEGL